MAKSEKIRYEVDPHNRLVLKSGKPSRVKTYRSSIDGTFKVDKNNYLIYHVKKPSPVFKSRRLPQQIKLKGSWSLTRQHNLVYTLNKWQNQIYGNKLILKSGLMDVKGNRLLFMLTTKKGRKSRTYSLGLTGSWRGDRFNRLTFFVEREHFGYNPITFKGEWSVNKNNQIIYRYKRKGKIYSLTFRGFWDIARDNRLLYRLDKSKGSVFEFRTGVVTYKKRIGLQCQIGIGLSQRMRPKMKIITLFGKWKIKKKLGLVFEMNCGKEKLHSILFGAWIKLNKDYTLEIDVRNRKNRPIGIKLLFSRTFFKNQAKSFINLLKDKRELAVVAGCGLLF